MTPGDLYIYLRQANATTACDPFDGHVLACIFAAGISECEGGVTLTDALGFSGSELQRIITRYFPGAQERMEAFGLDGEPIVEEDEQCLRELLWRFRTVPGSYTSLLSVLIARRATRPNHLWQDLGLTNRGELSRLMLRHFDMLARRNTLDMKWKKFFFRMICRDEGYRMCSAPSCSECSDFKACFGDESGESLLARARLQSEASGLIAIQPAYLQ
jgi:nitrogen fixation protein NifQ